MNNLQRYISAAHLEVDGASVLHGTRRVLVDVNLTVAPGERIGLIGANGSGKSTLLKLIAGTIDSQSASGSISAPASLGILAQELAPTTGLTLENVIETAVAPIRSIGTRIERAAANLGDPSAAEDYERALVDAEHEGLWQLDARIASVLTGLGLGALPRSRSISAMSGGQRRRLEIAALLLSRASALVLDEPTNHLDDDAIAFLEQELRGWPRPVLFASHDRAFLDALATGIVDLDLAFGPGGPSDGIVQGRRYTGGFSGYLAGREADRLRWQKAYEAQQAERSRLEHVIAVDARNVFHTTAPRGDSRITVKFEADRAAKTVGGRLRQARQRLDVLDRSRVHEPPRRLEFAGFATRPPADAEPDENPRLVAQLDRVAVAGRLAEVSLEIEASSRILIEGPNGAGKSTLLALIAGGVRPSAGSVRVTAPVGLLGQYDEWEDLTLSAEDAYRSTLEDAQSGPSLAEMGLLEASAARLPLAALSYGQCRRVALARFVAHPPAILLLDEPTNHLALSLAEDLERAIPDYPGAVVIASHDRWLRERWSGSVLRLTPTG